jgi:hypothetical protein
VAAAQLRLEQLSDPAGAKRLFRDADRPGALREEAIWGIGAACRAVGDAECEKDALRDYTRRFPDGAMASVATARLVELSSRSRDPNAKGAASLQ